MEPYQGDSVNLGEIAELGGFNKVGEYVARLNRMDPTKSRKGEPMLVVYFEILEGQYEGEEIRFNFWLGARKDKQTGRIFAPGVSEFKHACAAINSPLGDVEFKLDAQAAGRLFGQLFINKRVRIKVLPDEGRTDAEGNPVPGKWSDGKWVGPTQPKLLGLAGPGGPGMTPATIGPAPEAPVSPLKGIV
jgi:hypothetical protein